jgi:alanyl-tRNA synthetase
MITSKLVFDQAKLTLGKISQDTLITFQNGKTEGKSTILATSDLSDDLIALIAEETPFHPLSYKWPDQPGDRGEVLIKEQIIPIQDSVAICLNKSTNEIRTNDLVKREELHEWYSLVAHIAKKSDCNSIDLIDQTCDLKVDAEYQNMLSVQHTGCHLSSLALNKALTRFWKKPIETDTLGSPDFDKNAIQDSKITPEKSLDQYRIGKSIRKKGLDSPSLLGGLDTVEESVNETLRVWVRSPINCFVTSTTNMISGSRMWNCELPDGNAKILCGGTHLASTADLEKIEVKLEKNNDDSFNMSTVSKLK